jgi:hypothetical protein
VSGDFIPTGKSSMCINLTKFGKILTNIMDQQQDCKMVPHIINDNVNDDRGTVITTLDSIDVSMTRAQSLDRDQ